MNGDRSTGTVGRYHRATRTATYGYLAGLPLLLFYEAVVVVGGAAAGSGVRLGAELWTKQLLGVLGMTGHVALGVVVVGVGIAVAWRDRRRTVPLRSRYFLCLGLESALYAVLLAVVVSRLVGLILGVIGPQQGGSFLMQIGLSVGAGLYEELVFRVLLVGALFGGIRVLGDTSRTLAYGIAAVIGAAVFSAVHYLGPFGDAFGWDSFAFRFFYGLALNALYIVRGFGVAAWTHALYDVMLVTAALG